VTSELRALTAFKGLFFCVRRKCVFTFFIDGFGAAGGTDVSSLMETRGGFYSVGKKKPFEKQDKYNFKKCPVD